MQQACEGKNVYKMFIEILRKWEHLEEIGVDALPLSRRNSIL
jgi:hypothetical protein